MIYEYLMKFHVQECVNILSEKDILGYYCIHIDFLKLFETDPDLGDKVLCSPITTLPYCDSDIIKAQKTIMENNEYKSNISNALITDLNVKKNVHCRFFGLPFCPELHRTIFPKNVDLGCFIKVTGTVVRVSQAKMLEYHRKYVCQKCKFENLVEAEFEQRYIIKSPQKCGNQENKCRCANFTQVNLVSREHCKDYQEIKIQEQVNKLSIGTIPGSMWVVLEDDLVDCCKPGDDINICGTVRRRWRPSVQTRKSEVELVLQANYVEVCNSQKSKAASAAPDVKECFGEYWSKFENCPMRGRDQILMTVCPQVYGLYLVKLALLLTVITGSNYVVENGVTKKNSTEDEYKTKIRGQCHLLLVGDPGTGKSQLLRAGAELTPRSVFTSGTGSTRAGLTCSALREDGEWQLEAGALVLADGGACCVDELSRLREHDRASIHEAMEQQTISIAKAGIVCKLNTRCAIIAACNPKGHYDTTQPLSVNVSIGTPLLSRFDLIFILLDSKNRAWDKLVSSFILFGANSTANKQWSMDKLQMYISLVGPRATKMTKSANIILQTYYMKQRMSEHRDQSRTTVRMLDSLVRLSQSHCRLMYRTIILPMDAITAVSLVDLSMQDCTLKDTVDALHSTLPKYPDYNYLLTAKSLLTKLNLHQIWHEELLYYAKVLEVDHKTLESDLERGSVKIFSKFDDIADDNIPLSCSVVTSSYFNKNRDGKEIDENICIGNNRNDKFESRNVVNQKLAETLKKHAALNKIESNAVLIKNQETKKRKRNQANSKSRKTKNTKKIKSNTSHQNENKTTDTDSDTSEDINTSALLKAIPSVNDEFSALEIKLELNNESNMCSEKDYCEKQSSNPQISAKSSVDKPANLNSSVNDHQLSTNRTAKLKQFAFSEKHNNSNLLDCKIAEQSEPNKSKVEKATTHRKEMDNLAGSSSSQISMFESTDCDIDIDL